MVVLRRLKFTASNLSVMFLQPTKRSMFEYLWSKQPKGKTVRAGACVPKNSLLSLILRSRPGTRTAALDDSGLWKTMRITCRRR
jgi:hypothetical protein